jgi:hypothetical protein
VRARGGRAGSEGRSGERDRPRERVVSTIVLILGAAFVLSSVLAPWYVVRVAASNGCTSISESLAPLGVAVSSSGAGCPTAELGSYVSAGLPSTGSLYLGIAALAGGAGLAVVSLSWFRLSKLGPRHPKLLLSLSMMAIVAAASAPALAALGQPSTVCQDQGFVGTTLGTSLSNDPTVQGPVNQSGGGSTPSCNSWSFWHGAGGSWVWSGQAGPWNSFLGSASFGGGNISWGPGIGWGLDLLGVWLIAAGTYLSWKAG